MGNNQLTSDIVEIGDNIRVYVDDLKSGYIEGTLSFINDRVINLYEHITDISGGCASVNLDMCVICIKDIKLIIKLNTIKKLIL